jgi:6,7-dimethyl-8-ribityllumazine synthase
MQYPAPFFEIGEAVATRRKGHGRTIEGEFRADGARFAVVVSRFNEYITSALLEGCVDTLNRHGVPPERIDVVRVPGAFEIPTAAKRIADRRLADAIVCLGCVIRGDTKHYDHVCREAAKGVAEVGRRTGVPCIFGILTVETLEQAIERAGTKLGNAGRSAALAALEMASLVRKL